MSDFAYVDADMVEEVKVHEFVAEIAELRWERFPSVIHTNMGNQLDFIVRGEARNDNTGDLLYVLYQQQYGAIQLRIFND